MAQAAAPPLRAGLQPLGRTALREAVQAPGGPCAVLPVVHCPDVAQALRSAGRALAEGCRGVQLSARRSEPGAAETSAVLQRALAESRAARAELRALSGSEALAAEAEAFACAGRADGLAPAGVEDALLGRAGGAAAEASALVQRFARAEAAKWEEMRSHVLPAAELRDVVRWVRKVFPDIYLVLDWPGHSLKVAFDDVLAPLWDDGIRVEAFMAGVEPAMLGLFAAGEHGAKAYQSHVGQPLASEVQPRYAARFPQAAAGTQFVYIGTLSSEGACGAAQQAPDEAAAASLRAQAVQASGLLDAVLLAGPGSGGPMDARTAADVRAAVAECGLVLACGASADVAESCLALGADALFASAPAAGEWAELDAGEWAELDAAKLQQLRAALQGAAKKRCREQPPELPLSKLPRLSDGPPGPAARLRRLLADSGSRLLLMPCCGDPLTAKLVLEAGFELTFLSGFSLSAYRGHPDTGLVSYGEVLDQATQVCEALQDRIPLICDADTGYGNPLNVKRTMRGLVRAGCAGVLLEDQENPKRCGHTRGKRVVERPEAEARLRAAVDARDELRARGLGDLVILARTDARATHSLEEALGRCQRFVELGADMTFMEAPRDVGEMRRYCAEVPGPKLANMLEGGLTPIRPPSELEDIGYKLAAYPLSLLSAGIKAQQEVLRRLKLGEVDRVQEMLLPFAETRRVVGFDNYYAEEERYK